MDNITKAKSELRLQNWAKLIAECQASSMTVTAWCSEHDINVKTYYYWLRKIRKRTLENMPAAAGELIARSENGSTVFKPLEVSSPVSGMPTAVIVHLPQATVEIAEGTDQQTIKAVLLAMRSVC